MTLYKQPQANSRRILRMKDVIEITGISRSGIYLKLSEHSFYSDMSFPRPFKIGIKTNGWIDADIQAWIDSKKNSGV